MIIRYDPFRDVERMARHAWGRTAAPRPGAVPMDACRYPDHLEVSLDLPGVDPDTIDVTVEKNTLSVKASRTREVRDGEEVLVAERSFGDFSRQLRLGDSLDPDTVTATYDRGVLTLTIPVAERSRARRVAVSTEAA